MPSFPPAGPISQFSDRLVALDLPRLPVTRRAEVVAFTGRRMATLPSPMRLGVTLVAVAVDGLGRAVGRSRLTSLMAQRPLPVLGDYVRLVRSLTYAYVWETWPDTRPDGAPRS